MALHCRDSPFNILIYSILNISCAATDYDDTTGERSCGRWRHAIMAMPGPLPFNLKLAFGVGQAAEG
jgi:hypothetical protein